MQGENFNDLLAFLAVAREGSFTRAASPAFALLVDALRYRR
jgi:hypothetical protein